MSPPLAPSALPAPAAVAATPRADVAREVASLDAAQRALLDGNPDSALRVLSVLEQMPGRALVPEATVLRVRALLARGSGAEARREAERFCVVAPSSPQAAVLRALIANNEIRATPSRL
jgi:outer membrane protein assembly factor BamD (BamD/ComL family)